MTPAVTALVDKAATYAAANPGEAFMAVLGGLFAMALIIRIARG